MAANAVALLPNEFHHINVINQRKEEFTTISKDYACSYGAVMRTREEASNPDVVVPLPFTLAPSPFPKHCFEQACRIQKSFNILMHKVANNYEFLRSCLENTVKVDDFTRRLWNIYEIIRAEGSMQPITLAMNRSDYMLDSSRQDEPALKQVEFNTMASSFGGVSPIVGNMHKFLMEVAGMSSLSQHIPTNGSCRGLARALVEAWKAYGVQSAVIVFLVLQPEQNIYDQRHLEFAVFAQHQGIRVLRRTLADFGDSKRVYMDEDRRLFIDRHEVSVVYQRCCYIPDHFKEEKDWQTRLMLEQSRAITCPSVHYHLAGTKKVQQVLTEKKQLEKFLPAAEAAELRKTFVQMYSLDETTEGDENLRKGVDHPERYVLKPQREGGGNNVYGPAIHELLQKMKYSSERTAFILMEKIQPKPVMNIPVRRNVSPKLQEMVSELGIFGILVTNAAGDIILNECPGHILRTKTIDTDEGGVATGFSFLDSPLLVGN